MSSKSAAARTDDLQEALDRLLVFACRATVQNGSSNPWGSALYFDATGKTRLAHIAGFIQGLVTAGGRMGPLEQLAVTGSRELESPRELALSLAKSIDDKLFYLAQYGGKMEIPVDEGKQVVWVPQYRVILYDDGCFGSFGVLWHRAITHDQWFAEARKNDEAAYQGREEDGTKLSADDSRRRWEAALDKADRDLRIRKELEENRLFTPQWVKERREELDKLHTDEKHEGYSYHGCKKCPPNSHLGPSYEFVRYGFSFNGGLILHGLQGWGLHT